MKPVKKIQQKAVPSKSVRRNWEPFSTVSHVQITPNMVAGNWVEIKTSRNNKSQFLLP
jgi:hypothetical protein